MPKPTPPTERRPVTVLPAKPQLSTLHHLPPTPTDDPTKPVAVLVCHGMGQQVPFATLASLADRLSSRPAHTVRHLHFEDPHDAARDLWLPRAEIEVVNPADPLALERPVHVYEAYWAPLVEGHIALTDVVRFLGSAGVRGVGLAFSPFLRWLFGKDRKFKIPRLTSFGLLGTLLLIVALVAINAVLLLVASQNLLTDLVGTTSTALVTRLTTDLASLLVVGLAAGAALMGSARCRRQPFRRLLDGLAWGLLAVACLTLIAVAGLMVWHYFDLRGLKEPLATGPAAATEWTRKAWVGAVWAVGLGASWWLRGFFVQYLGDVAIYVDAYKVDQYHELRERIREQANRTACALYGAREDAAPGAAPASAPPFLYERILVVGHSLGSVIAYDALNATLKLDEILAQGLAVKERTQALITFGSPLDKTAFIFHAQLPKNSLRAALAASVQPLIRDPAVRQAIAWTNLYSRADVISGSLDFYDYPYSTLPWRVNNVLDPEATTPAAAHNQYWDNALLSDTIRQAIFAP